jgi:pyruvate/2-oxoglutarate dehydrogenase complex dihydrolipoamide acyltransferase (E2) component
MKMEHSIVAPHDGAVEQVRYRVGDQVEEGATLVSLHESDSPVPLAGEGGARPDSPLPLAGQGPVELSSPASRERSRG